MSEIMTDREIERVKRSYLINGGSGLTMMSASHKRANARIRKLEKEIKVRDRAMEYLREGQQYISPENAMLVARGQIESERAEIEKEGKKE